MFAFALWDKKEKLMTLARDRIGEKPLYYGLQGSTFVFGSELKALKMHPDWVGGVDRDTLALQMQYGYIPAPYSIYKNVRKLMPGTYIQYNLKDRELGESKEYWSLKNIYETHLNDQYNYGDDHAINSLDKLLNQTIKEKMISDVPLGAFLSGGIDSSTLVALMQHNSVNKIKTFSIGFFEKNYNEAHHAKRIADYLKTDHTELYVTDKQVMDVIPKLSCIYDEPFSDSSQIPTFLVSEMASKDVKVAISGDAGDELFAGYNRYIYGQNLWDKFLKVPQGMQSILSKTILNYQISSWDKLANFLSFFYPLGVSRPGEKLHKFANLLPISSQEELYSSFVSSWSNPLNLVLNSEYIPTKITDTSKHLASNDFVNKMMYLDSMMYLPDDILCKVDRASMYFGLETRSPFLDHRIVEFASRVPIRQKIRNGQGKWILRQVLYKYVPRELIDHPKMGFSIPIGIWLRGPLRDWAESLLNSTRLEKEGYLNATLVQEKWSEHLSGKRDWQHLLWNVLMFQAWLNDH
jgi:asparagine synthase (glutamine-hydrolysing)